MQRRLRGTCVLLRAFAGFGVLLRAFAGFGVLLRAFAGFCRCFQGCGAAGLRGCGLAGFSVLNLQFCSNFGKT